MNEVKKTATTTAAACVAEISIGQPEGRNEFQFDTNYMFISVSISRTHAHTQHLKVSAR